MTFTSTCWAMFVGWVFWRPCEDGGALVPTWITSRPRRVTSIRSEGPRRCALDDNIDVDSSILGHLKRIRPSGEGQEDSFLGTMSVPTFASIESADPSSIVGTHCTGADAPNTLRARGLDGVLQGPAFKVDHVLTQKSCDEVIEASEKLGFGSYRAGKNFHGALQIVVSPETCDAVGRAIAPFLNVGQVASNMMDSEVVGSGEEEEVRLVYAGLNRRWRVYRYQPGGDETFAPHIDAGFPPSGLSEDKESLLWNTSGEKEQIVSRLTILIYLNDDFVGGETNFYRPVAELKDQATTAALIASIHPQAGSILVFPQAVGEHAMDHARQYWPLHEGAPVVSGTRPKYVVRSDVLFATQREPVGRMAEDKLFQFDHLVRDAFLPRGSVYNRNFLNHVSALYNPHMGVENLGPFLYSFIRFTKQLNIVEIGAGYTSLWILQALYDNDIEMKRIKNLQRGGKCRLLDIPWSVPSVVDDFDQSFPSLLSIDNCLHQKETATGAFAIAKELGLGHFMKFVRQDAFELNLDSESIDILWCDFGVGTRMTEFVSKAWGAIRPGGFLLCHSTLTNERTRAWLEAARSRQGQNITGIPAEQYVELSLLEPQKHYQNSISIFQKRQGMSGNKFEEPVYSEYA